MPPSYSCVVLVSMWDWQPGVLSLLIDTTEKQLFSERSVRQHCSCTELNKMLAVNARKALNDCDSKNPFTTGLHRPNAFLIYVHCLARCLYLCVCVCALRMSCVTLSISRWPRPLRQPYFVHITRAVIARSFCAASVLSMTRVKRPARFGLSVWMPESSAFRFSWCLSFV